jgi:hypothetical protein
VKNSDKKFSKIFLPKIKKGGSMEWCITGRLNFRLCLLNLNFKFNKLLRKIIQFFVFYGQKLKNGILSEEVYKKIWQYQNNDIIHLEQNEEENIISRKLK